MEFLHSVHYSDISIKFFPLLTNIIFELFSYFRYPRLQIWHLTLLFSTDDKEEVSAMINFHIILSISINILIDYEKEATDMFHNFLTYIFLKKFHKLERVLQNNKI